MSDVNAFLEMCAGSILITLLVILAVANISRLFREEFFD